MIQRKGFLFLMVAICVCMACGPDTIFLRPHIDTPEQHVKNGHSLLSRGKYDAATAEFRRAQTLDDSYVPAYMGIALVQGQMGNVANGLAILNQAEPLVNTADERQEMDRCYQRLRAIKETNLKQ